MTVLWANQNLRKTGIKIIQINLGNKCNQNCFHCHIGASPNGKKNMDKFTATNILSKLFQLDVESVEFTGGAPEFNPHLAMLLEELWKCGKQSVVRTNLTVLDIPEYTFFIDLYKKFKVKIVASLPSCFKELTDKQRGLGVFDKSIRILKKLNEVGYGTGDLDLELVYNPQGMVLPPSQEELEKDYKKLLKDLYSITFNRLITITNTPIGGFKKYLISEGKFDDYMQLLVDNFNPDTLNDIMCRHLLSVDYKGYIYDCDFNLAIGIRVKDYEDKRFWEIDFNDFNPEITCLEHCYACTVNRGSSCHGVLIKKQKDLDIKETIKQYYGSELKSTLDLKAGVCCTIDTLPPYVKEVLPYIAEEVKERYYGCGSSIPLVLKGLNVLDIGCGTGRDCYVLSKLVGENGTVYGIDMTDSQIKIARKYLDLQTSIFGYKKSNVFFIHDYIENIETYIHENSLDLVVSNCVVNLLEDKEKLLHSVYRMLKFGGEFYFSDIYSDRRLPEELRKNPVLYSECLGGALYWRDFERLARKAGFSAPRIFSKRVVDISNEEIKKLTGNITFYSITYRLWKIEGLEDACEDYGHVVIYMGGISESPFHFRLDSTHIFEKDKPERVCGNTALMLSKTRFSDYFQVIGSFEKHFGEFKDCGIIKIQDQKNDNEDSCSCR
jgi:radical SAM/Cys-rich protein